MAKASNNGAGTTLATNSPTTHPSYVQVVTGARHDDGH